MGIARIAAVVVVCALIVGGVWIGLSMFAPTQQDPDIMTIKFTAKDTLAGGVDATTSAVDIYKLVDGDYVSSETVTMDTAQKESGFTYTTGETLYYYIYDATDTSVCKRYMQWTVPQGTPAQVYDGSFQCEIPNVDRGDTAYDMLIQYHNNTAIAASATIDVTNESWDSDYAEVDVELRNTNDDTGYVNSHNFIRGYDNNHFLVMSASGTGYDSVNILTTSTNYGAITVIDKANVRYWVIDLDNDAITRDKLSVGNYNPDGTLSIPLTFDLTGFEAGDSVTFSYMYKYYASYSHFEQFSSWGVDAANNPASESVTIQY